MMRRTRTGCVLTMAAAVAAGAQASVMTFDDHDLFLAASGASSLETFESETTRNILPSETMIESGLHVAVSGTGWQTQVTTQNAMSYNTTEGGDRHLRVAFGTGTYALTFSHTERMYAFGFNITGFQDFPGAGGFEVDLWSDGQIVDSIFMSSPGTFAECFHGITSVTGFDALTVRIHGTDAAGFDDIAVAMFAVPTPGALAMLLAAGLAGGRRRRA